jgi:hypothetical protein
MKNNHTVHIAIQAHTCTSHPRSAMVAANRDTDPRLQAFLLLDGAEVAAVQLAAALAGAARLLIRDEASGVGDPALAFFISESGCLQERQPGDDAGAAEEYSNEDVTEMHEV